ncbi:MAG: preprotein translocase subunit SecE [bacterium]
MKIFNYFKRLKSFLVEVRGEFKKVTWPPRREVYGTTIVVIITVFFFGFYLYGLDVAMSYLAAELNRLVGA